MMPSGPGREHHALIVETGHQHVDAVADRAEHVLLRHLAILEDELRRVGAAHAELVELLRLGETLEALLDDKRRHAARARRRIGLGVDHEGLGHRTVGDPHLGAVEDVAVASSVGARAHRDDVRAGVRLRHRERADMLARDELRQIALLLLLGAVAVDLVDAEIGMRAVGEADRRRAARNLFHRDTMREVAEPCPAVFLRNRDAEHAELAKLRPEVARECVVAVDRVGARRDLTGREARNRFAQRVHILTEREVEAPPGIRDHAPPPSRILPQEK